MSQADDGARIDAFLDALWLEQGVSDHTLAAYRRDLAAWSARLAGRGEALLTPAPEALPAWLDERREAGYRLTSNARLLASLRRFYRWCLEAGTLSQDPLAEVRLPRVRPTLPNTLEKHDVERLIAAPDVTTELGLRDRPKLEQLNTAGMPLSELVPQTTNADN